MRANRFDFWNRRAFIYSIYCIRHHMHAYNSVSSPSQEQLTPSSSCETQSLRTFSIPNSDCRNEFNSVEVGHLSGIALLFSEIPTPMLGVANGVVGTAKMWALAGEVSILQCFQLTSPGTFAMTLCPIVAMILVLLYIIKLLSLRRGAIPIIFDHELAPSHAAGSMALMQLGDFVAVWGSLFAGQFVWSLGVFIWFCIWFVTVRHFVVERSSRTVESLHPALYVPIVGIVAAAVTCPRLGPDVAFASKCLFWFGFTGFLLVLIPLSYAALVRKPPISEVGTYGVLLAPASLCYVGFQNSDFAGTQGLAVQVWVEYGLLALHAAGFILFLSKSPTVIVTLYRHPNPSMAGLTFPTIIFTVATLLFYRSLSPPPPVAVAALCLILLALASLVQVVVAAWFIMLSLGRERGGGEAIN